MQLDRSPAPSPAAAQAAHTPGPYHCTMDRCVYALMLPEEVDGLRNVTRWTAYVQIGDDRCSPDEARAVARLLAQAPTLLAQRDAAVSALRDLAHLGEVMFSETDEVAQVALQAARDAIRAAIPEPRP